MPRVSETNNEEPPFEDISLTDLILHTLLDMYEFSAHSFVSAEGPYFWNGIGIDFEAPFPEKRVLQHAKEAAASTIYLAHTHPLSNDESFNFLDAPVDPREQIAFGHRQLPIGNKPSAGDVLYLAHLQKRFAEIGIQAIGVVFSASGIWKFNIPELADFDAKKFKKAYDGFYPLKNEGNFLEEWSAKDNFPSYYMELQKPQAHHNSYTLQIMSPKDAPDSVSAFRQEIAGAVRFFDDNGVKLAFLPYTKMDIHPRILMSKTMNRWANTFPA
ncbi:MAG TPA: hypothetical protein VHB72_02245 [Candidatus Saccharimonadales bacterium]|nr:hypothetical protein [Candidatus Saccharimonadales bacterium]